MKQVYRKYSTTFLTILFALTSAIVCANALAKEIYSWTDKDGVIHFGEKPPEGQQVRAIDVPEVNQSGISDPSTQTPEAPTNEAAADVMPDEEEPVPLTAAQARREKMANDRKERNEAQAEKDLMCQKHRKRVEQMEPYRRVFYTNEQGESVRMDDDMRIQLVEESKDYVAKNCD